MFRRLPRGLPQDPTFPTDLKGLGYFINESDEIRSIENHDKYFKYLLSKNERYNDAQRESMNQAVRDIVDHRLHELDLAKVRLPLGASPSSPHVPIYISANLSRKSHVILVFGEHLHDLGVFTHRIINGPGGINQGSAVNFVKHIQAMSFPTEPTVTGPEQDCRDQSPKSPGIILANVGQLRYSHRFKKSMTQFSWYGMQRASAVEKASPFDLKRNTIPENRSAKEHVQYVLEKAIRRLAHSNAQISIIGVSMGADLVVEYFLGDKSKSAPWNAWKDRINAIALLAPLTRKEDVEGTDFGSWLKKRGRAYVISDTLSGLPISDSDGDKYHRGIGCPAYSLGEPYYNECLLPKGFKTILEWFSEVAMTQGYKNPEVTVFEAMGTDPQKDETEVRKGDEEFAASGLAWSENNDG